MWQILSVAILALIVVIAEWLANKTKGLVSAFFTVSLLLMLGYWFVFPHMSIYDGTDVATVAGVSAIANIFNGAYLTHIGSMITVKDVTKQWKTVLTGFLAVLILGAALPTLGSLLIDRYMAWCGTPIVAGGAVANILMNEVLTSIEVAKGVDLDYVKVFCVLVLALQSMIGVPICSIIMRKDAQRFLNSPEEYAAYRAQTEQQENDAANHKKLITMPKCLQTTTGYLFMIMVISTIGYWIGTVTGGKINSLLACMLLGVISATVGLLPANALNAAQSNGFLILFATIFVVQGVSKATPALVLSCLKPLIVIFALGILLLAVAGFIASKLFKMSFGMCFAIGTTALFGAPATVYVSNEVSQGVGRDDEERKVLLAYILPKIMIAGFSTLTVGSVILATILIPIISKL